MTIYCLIDEISGFEKTSYNWKTELCEVSCLFQSLVDKHCLMASIGPVFKVLLTSAQRSITVIRQIHPVDQVALSSSEVLPRSLGVLSKGDLLTGRYSKHRLN